MMTGITTGRLNTRFMTSSITSRLIRISPGFTGRLSSSSLSRASKSCDLAKNTLPINISPKSIITAIAYTSQSSPTAWKGAASTSNRCHMPKPAAPKA